MNINEIKDLMNHFNNSNITSMEFTCNETHLSLKKENGYLPVPPVQVALPQATLTTLAPTAIAESNMPAQPNTLSKIKAPLVGVFYTSPSPGVQPFVTVWQQVKKGDVVGLIEAMKMIMEIKSTVNGVVKNILCKNEEVLGFEDVIMEIEEQ